jgi:hypothetical protein
MNLYNTKTAEIANSIKDAIKAMKLKDPTRYDQDIDHLQEVLDLLLDRCEEVSTCTYCAKYAELQTCQIRDCKLCEECMDESTERLNGDMIESWDYENHIWSKGY